MAYGMASNDDVIKSFCRRRNGVININGGNGPQSKYINNGIQSIISNEMKKYEIWRNEKEKKINNNNEKK
jgi:hypothetical protein